MIPAGLEKDFNIYVYNKKVKVLINGKKVNYNDLPVQTRSVFVTEMNNNKRVLECLTQMGCSQQGMEEMFVSCRFGSLNQKPDLINNQTYPDAPNCDQIRSCPGYGTVCLIPCNLTRQEYQVARLISLGKLDKEICILLEIAMSTCRTYIERIREKLGVTNRVEIALWAHNLE